MALPAILQRWTNYWTRAYTPPAVVQEDGYDFDEHDYAERLPRGYKGTISTAGSFFGFYGLRGRSPGFLPTPWNPDSLVQRKGLKIYREMAHDEQIKAALLAKQYAVLSAGYSIQLPQLPEDAKKAEIDAAEEHKEFIEFNFQEMKGSIEAKLRGIMDALVAGFSVSEKVFHLIDYGKFEGKWGIKDIRTRPPEDFEFHTDDSGELLKDGVWQFDTPMPAHKFVIYSHQAQYGNLYGQSDLRAAYAPWWSKTNMMKLMAVSLERYAEPIAVATYKGLLTASQRDDIDAFLKNLQSRSGILIPETVMIDFKAPPPRAAEAFIPALEFYNQQMRIAILMPGLIGLSGEQQIGSFARAVKEFDVFLWIIGQLRKDLEIVLNEQVVKPLIDLNYEVDHGMYPKFEFNEITEEAKYKQFELFLMGLGAGALNKGPEDENKLREMINFEPLPDDFVPPEQMMLPGGQSPFGGFPQNGFNGNGAQAQPNPDDAWDVGYAEEQQLVKFVESLRSGKRYTEDELIKFVDRLCR